MKKTAMLLAIILLASTSISYGEPKTKKKKTAATSTKKVSADQAQKEIQKYTTEQIDINLEKLPPNYFGNDPKSIYFAIQKRKNSAAKGEFETTEQFQKRRANENSLPIIGQISLDGLFSLQTKRSEIKYSADASEFIIEIELGKVSEPLGYSLAKMKNPAYKADNYNENAKEISLTYETVGSRTYIGSNSYGATTEVSEHNSESYNSAVANYNEFPFKETIKEDALRRAKETEDMYRRAGLTSYMRNTISDYDKEWRLRTTVKANPDEAKTLKNNIKVLLIAKLDEPLISDSFYHKAPTMDSPSEYTSTSRYIYMNLKEIWIYNQVTGQIYSKIKRLAEK